ncbi:MAG TPA: T9SS type A sorting domain-containing protein [Candidatus Kryptonia bacterium]
MGTYRELLNSRNLDRLSVIGLIILIALSCFQFAFASGIRGDEKKARRAQSVAGQSLTLIDANNLTSWVQADALFPPIINGSFNGAFPKGVNAGFVFQDGIVFGGLVSDGSSPILRIGGTTYPTGMQPGKILVGSDGKVIGPEDAGNPAVNKVWRVRPDYATAELTQDAAAYFQEDLTEVTGSQIDSLRSNYASDWENWPADRGAPYVDVNGDGKYESDVDVPGIDGAAQTIWLVANDLNPGVTWTLYGSPPIGIEEQITEWTWPSTDYKELDNMFYKQVKLIYKGTTSTTANAHIDSMYIAQWSDVDDGDGGNDLAGCDSTMNIGFVYNGVDSDRVYSPLGLAPPAGGYVIVNGSARATGNLSDSAIIDLKWRRGYKYFYNVPMTEFWSFWDGTNISDPDLGSYDGTCQMFNLFRGALPLPQYPAFAPLYSGFPPPYNYQMNYVFGGNPVTRSGFVDGKYNTPSGRRIILVHGPIEMNLNDTAEVVIATVGAEGINYISSVSILLYYAKWAQYAFTSSAVSPSITAVAGHPVAPATYRLDQNYPNPFNPATVIGYDVPLRSHIVLAIYDVLGRKIETLVDGEQNAGHHVASFDGSNYASGMYFYRLSTPGFTITKKMLLTK